MKKLQAIPSLSISLFVLLFMVSAFSVYSQDQHDAIIEKMTREYTLMPDGKLEYRQYKKLKLLTYNSIHRMYGETFIIYNPKYQKLKVLSAMTTMRDGTKVQVPANAFNEVLPRYAANAPAYNHLKEMVVTHTGLELGSTIELDYTISSALGFLPGLLSIEILTELSPVKVLEVIVRVPADKMLSYKLLNIKSEALMQTEGQFKVYRWEFKDLPNSLPEAFQPESVSVQPMLLLSSLTNHATLASWLETNSLDRQDLGEDLGSMLNSMRKEEKDDLKLSLRLQEKIVNETVQCGVPFNMSGYRARGPQETWQTAYGTTFERANLLTQMLRAVNISAELVAVVPGAYSLDIVSPGLWEDFGVLVMPKKGEPVFLSVRELQSQNFFITGISKKFLPIPGMKELKAYAGDNLVNQAILEVQGTINDKHSLKADFSITLRGSCVPYLEFTRAEGKASALIGGMGRSTMKDGSIEKLQSMTCIAETSLDKDFELKQEGKYFFLAIPYPEKGINAWHLPELPESRRQLFEIPFPIREEINMTLDLPADVIMVNAEADKQIVNAAGSMSFKLKRSGDKLVVSKVLVLKRDTFVPAYYSGLRELLNNWNSKASRELVFKTR